LREGENAQVLTGLADANRLDLIIFIASLHPQRRDMEIHPPHAIHSVKDFLLQLLTITAGILIA